MTATNERGVEHCDDADEATLLCCGEEVLTFAIPRDQSCINDTHPVLTMRERLHNLADENAKLRELCGELAGELHALGVDFERIGWCGLRDELRELGIGIEVTA